MSKQSDGPTIRVFYVGNPNGNLYNISINLSERERDLVLKIRRTYSSTAQFTGLARSLGG